MLKERIAAEVLEPQPFTVWRASQVGDCPTKLWLMKSGHKPLPYRGTLKHVLDDGRQHELDVLRRLVSAGFKVYYSALEQQVEVKVSDVPYVVGHPDGIIQVPKGADLGELDRCDPGFDMKELLFLIEITAPNHFLWHAIKSRGIREVQPWKYVQVQMYLHSEEVMQQTNSAVMIVKNKNTSELYEEGIVYDEALARDVLDRLLEIERLDKMPNYRCSGTRPYVCGYRHLCFEEEAAPKPVGALQGNSLAEAEDLNRAVQMWKEGKVLYSRGSAMMDDSREYIRGVMKDYGCSMLLLEGAIAQVVEQQRRHCDLEALKEKFPQAYDATVDVKKVEMLRLTER